MVSSFANSRTVVGGPQTVSHSTITYMELHSRGSRCSWGAMRSMENLG